VVESAGFSHALFTAKKIRRALQFRESCKWRLSDKAVRAVTPRSSSPGKKRGYSKAMSALAEAAKAGSNATKMYHLRAQRLDALALKDFLRRVERVLMKVAGADISAPRPRHSPTSEQAGGILPSWLQWSLSKGYGEIAFLPARAAPGASQRHGVAPSLPPHAPRYMK
jgi:metal-dependent amidase/aminoacylase/carboxypeptidase family protein